jgi:hypothetical protein
MGIGMIDRKISPNGQTKNLPTALKDPFKLLARLWVNKIQAVVL